MVNSTAPQLGLVFAALADPTRRAILQRLAQGDTGVTELAEPFNVSLPAISKHLAVLEKAGLVVRERRGRTRQCRLVAAPMKEALDWIAQYRGYWERQLDVLEDYLAELQSEVGAEIQPGPQREEPSP
jgi:DNA-binding transcriptional ArsR family regulator